MITEEQIQHLHRFCVKHYVRFYDLQLELVDHLVNAIEQKMDEYPKLNFKQALNEVYKGFGIFGFSRIVAERDLALRKNYRKNFTRSFLSYFTPPRVLLTCLIFILLTVPVFFIQRKGVNDLFMVYCILAGVVGVAGVIFGLIKFKRPKKQLLMLHCSGGVFGLFAAMLQLPNFYFNLFLQGRDIHQITFSNAHIFFVTGIVTVISLLFLAYYDTFKNLYYSAIKEYPLVWETE
ncbi:MAG: hypothetical protein IPH58_00340 [Sphingobacteriales bacterium]|jgi:hypothetical protein|nr:hypothetical protein [Sphingobacteriales bacterium]